MLVVLPCVLSGCSGVGLPGDSPLDTAQSDDIDQASYTLPCLLCHTSPVGRRQAVVDESGAGGHTFGGELLTDAECRLCHDTIQHAWGSVRLWRSPFRPEAVIEVAGDPSKDPAEADKVSEFCTACHNGADYAVHQVSGDWQPACTACHDLHDPDGANLTLVSGLVYNRTLDIDKAVTFSGRTGSGSFDDGDPTVHDGICQVCHTDTFYHRHDGAGPAHFDGEDCTGCHPHDAGFMSTDETSCLICHSRPQGDRHAITDASGAGGHALQGGVLVEADCVVCHELTQHRQGAVRLWGNPNDPLSVIELSADPSVDTVAAGQLIPFCEACHEDVDFAVHQVSGDWKPACTACHDLHDPDNANLALVSASIRNLTLDIDKAVVFSGRTGSGSFDDGDPTVHDGICQVCHTDTFYHRHDGAEAAHFDGENCITCHPHDAGFIPTDETSCLICHSRPQGGRHAIGDVPGAGGHVLQGGVLTEADCVVCHEMTRHRQSAVRLWADPNDPSSVIELSGDPSVDVAAAAQLIPFCEACHEDPDYEVHQVSGDWQPACTACHDLHDPDNANLALVSASIRNQTLDIDKPVVFSGPTGLGSFSTSSAVAPDGICQVCHTVTMFHLHNGTGAPHQEGEDCSTCHSHGTGFVPDASLSCSICHNLAQGARRPIGGEFGLASRHVHGEVVGNADCTVCHEMTAHQQGQVRLRNVDDPENPASVISLSDSPLSSPAEAARLEPFCLACHDADGARGAAPFTDGAIPPPIDAGLWASASHGSGQMTCFGNGKVFGCHSTGHGSMKVDLLAPWDASQPTLEGDMLREQEGLCYLCHDTDGPAATDIESQFALATRHNVSSLDQADGSAVECTHCHNPHEVTNATSLTDPDSGRLWTGSSEAFCLTCHDGSPPAGVSFPPTSPGTGFDKSAFVGTTHDSELGESSCRHCHRPHGSSHLAILKERYLVADYNEYSTGDGDFAACWLCHDEENTIERENAFEYRHEKHVKDERSPCIICHDVHAGIDAGEPGLINMAYPVQRGYDIELIGGADGTTSFWIDATENEGNCLTTCHGEVHDPQDYDRAILPTTDCSACH